MNGFVAAALDDLHEQLRPFYSDIGRPSVDPELIERGMGAAKRRCGKRSGADDVNEERGNDSAFHRPLPGWSSPYARPTKLLLPAAFN
jgi:hypothetical protein